MAIVSHNDDQHLLGWQPNHTFNFNFNTDAGGAEDVILVMQWFCPGWGDPNEGSGLVSASWAGIDFQLQFQQRYTRSGHDPVAMQVFYLLAGDDPVSGTLVLNQGTLAHNYNHTFVSVICYSGVNQDPNNWILAGSEKVITKFDPGYSTAVNSTATGLVIDLFAGNKTGNVGGRQSGQITDWNNGVHNTGWAEGTRRPGTGSPVVMSGSHNDETLMVWLACMIEPQDTTIDNPRAQTHKIARPGQVDTGDVTIHNASARKTMTASVGLVTEEEPLRGDLIIQPITQSASDLFSFHDSFIDANFVLWDNHTPDHDATGNGWTVVSSGQDTPFIHSGQVEGQVEFGDSVSAYAGPFVRGDLELATVFVMDDTGQSRTPDVVFGFYQSGQIPNKTKASHAILWQSGSGFAIYEAGTFQFAVPLAVATMVPNVPISLRILTHLSGGADYYIDDVLVYSSTSGTDTDMRIGFFWKDDVGITDTLIQIDYVTISV